MIQGLVPWSDLGRSLLPERHLQSPQQESTLISNIFFIKVHMEIQGQESLLARAIIL